MFLFRPLFSDREESRGEEGGTLPAHMSGSFVHVPQNPTSEEELDAEYHFVRREDLDEGSGVRAGSQEPEGSEEQGAPQVHCDDGEGQFAPPLKVPPPFKNQNTPIRDSTFGPNPPFPDVSSSIPQQNPPKAPAQTATVRSSNQYATPLIPSYDTLPRAIQSSRAASGRRQLAEKSGRRFSVLHSVAQDTTSSKPPSGPKYTNSVLGGKLKGRAGPVRQPTLPPDAGELKKGARGNFERKRKSGAA